MRSPASSSARARAWVRPVSFSGVSEWPCTRRWRFQSVSPCLARRIVVIPGYASGAMDLGLRDKACLVTGSTGGIGRETARLLAEEGARVATCGRGEAPGVGETLHLTADLAIPGEPERVVGAAVEGFGGLDCLVNNVGAARQAKFEEVPDEEWDAYWQLNL